MLRLIGDDETEAVEYGGATFTVRVKSGTWWDDLRTRHVFGGRIIDAQEYEREVAQEILAGWDGIVSPDGEAIPYAKDQAYDVWRRLPEDCQAEISNAARARFRKYRDAAKNSEASSSSSDSGTATPSDS